MCTWLIIENKHGDTKISSMQSVQVKLFSTSLPNILQTTLGHSPSAAGHGCRSSWSQWKWGLFGVTVVNYDGYTRWWFQTFFIFTLTLGRWSILTNIFQMGWNHQLGIALDVPPPQKKKKLTWLAGNSTMNEDVFPIENGGCSNVRLVLRGVS